ncbi:MAG: DUF1236 domain-containing protein [Pseudorhizobium sp.]
MNSRIIILSATALAIFAPAALAQEGTVNGAAGGAVTGAIVGGPVGAAVGGVVGAIAGTAIDPPPREVITYVEQQPVPTAPIVVEQEIVVGKPVPETVVLTTVPQAPTYAYAVVNERRVIVDPQTRVVIEVLN